MWGNRKTIYTLSGIILLGFLLRLWGVGHGLNDELFTHPDEIPFVYTSESFARGFFSINPTHLPLPLGISPLWIYLQALGTFLYSLFIGSQRFLFGIRDYLIEIPNAFGVLLIGRLIAAIIGGMTIPLVYLTTKRLFDEKEGLVAAAIMSVIILHVRHSHFAYIDVPQTFFLVLSFYFMVKVSMIDNEGRETKEERREKNEDNNSSLITHHSFLAGIFLALAVATKVSAAPAFISLVLAHYLREKGIKGLIRSKCLYISILGLILGYSLCVPYFWLNPSSFLSVINNALNTIFGVGGPSNLYGRISRIPESIMQLSLILSEHIGLPLLVLFLFGLLVITFRERHKVILLLSFPLTYLPFFIAASWHDERELIPILPFIVIVMAYGIYRIAEIIPFKRKGTIMLVLSLFFTLPSLWISLKADYFLWQKDTRILAAEWIRGNLPLNARIGMEGHIYYNIPIYHERYELNGNFSDIPLEEVKKKIDFVIISSIIYNSLGPEKKKYYDSLKEKSQLIKAFNTVPSYFFNPRIEIYNLSRQGKASTSIIPKTYSEKDTYYMSFSEGAYGKEPFSFWIWPGTKIKRVLISEEKLKTIGIFIYNGSEKTSLRIKAGFKIGAWQAMTLHPYERRAILLNPSRSFPFIKYIYNISISCGEKGGAFVNIQTDPKRIANTLLELGDWEGAISILSKDDLKDKEGWSLLGLAYSMGERPKEALKAFRNRLSPFVTEATLVSDKEFEKVFEGSTNIDPAFLRDSLTVSYSADQLYNIVGKKGSWIAHFDPDSNRPGVLLFGPYKRFPIGDFKAVFRIRVMGSGEKPAARIDVFNGDTILTEKIIKDTRGKTEEFSLDFYNDEPDRPLEFRVEALGGRELWAEDIKVFPDIQGHYKRFLGMIHHYWGFSAGELGLSEEALEHFRIADVLGYRDTNSLYRMASIYEKMNMEKEAMMTYKEIISNVPNHIDSLTALKRIQGFTSERWIEDRIEYLTSQYKVRQNFSDLIEFIGYNIDRAKIQPGGEFKISYFWRALKKIRTNYFIFVHIQREGGIVFQNDHSPPVPMKRWREGEVTREDFTVRVPSDAPAGNYDIVIGVWDPEGSRESIKLKGRTIDKIKIGTIEVSDKP